MNADACQSRDPDIIASKKALERAARKTGTPFYVLKDGKVVDLNRARKRKQKRERQPRRA